jgi:hypothetical protein
MPVKVKDAVIGHMSDDRPAARILMQTDNRP